MININGLEYTYPDGTKALNGVDLEVKRGESIGIIGPNGAGKTTLLLHLNGILRGKGKIEVCGMPINNGNLEKIRKKVQIIFQDPDDQLFMPTVFDDVAFGLLNIGYPKEKIEHAVKVALRCVEMEGYQQRCSHHLSFGEKKRIAIATCLAMQPEVLAFDEPTISLDPRARRHLIRFLKVLDVTKIIATHDLELVLAVCSRVSIIDKGKIIAQGQTREILQDEELLEAHGLEVPLSIRYCKSC
jgi:cobalt/nickel transport system ATP-binding protein